MPKVTIIIVTYNSAAVLKPCLKALHNQTFQNFEVVVIDNQSEDNSGALVRELMPQARLQVSEDNIGFAAANNWGVRNSQSEYVFFLNADCFLAPNYIEEMVQVLDSQSEKTASITGILYRDEAKSEVDSTGLVLKPWQAVAERVDKSPGEVWGVSGAALFIRRSALKRVKPSGFDESFGSYKEDVDLAYRLRSAGYQAWCTDKTWARHLRGVRRGQPRSERTEIKRILSYRNHLLMLKNNLTFSTWLRYGILIVGYELLKAIYLLIREPRVLFLSWRGLL